MSGSSLSMAASIAARFFSCSFRIFSSTVVARDQLVGSHDAGLPDAMGAVGGLRLDRGIPPRI